MSRLVLLLVWLVQICRPQDIFPEKDRNNRLPKNTAGLTWQVLNINNLWTWHRSDGEGNHSPGGEDGMAYPAFTARCIYEDNILFGGIMYVGGWPEQGGTKAAWQPLRVNGGHYFTVHGLVPGWVEGTGAFAGAADTYDPAVRIYRIRRDYAEMTDAEVLRDAAISNELISQWNATQTMADIVRQNYERDWNEWPIDRGAPYIERNGIPGYQTPPAFNHSFTSDSLALWGYDEPGIGTADQILFTVFNCLDSTKSRYFVGSLPMGLEIQKTVWGYTTKTSLGNSYFVLYKFINKGGVDIGGGQKGAFFIDSLTIGHWMDSDLGYAGDDLVGCDTILNLGYTYNGKDYDLAYGRYNLPPPAVGSVVLGGPLVQGSPGDSGVFFLKRYAGKKNLGMTSISFNSAGPCFECEFPYNEYERGTARAWAMLHGYAPIGRLNDPFYPFPGPPGYAATQFPFSGDPVSQTGFIDGLGTTYSFAPGDRRIQVNTGPVRMAPGDTVEVLLAVVGGMGGDRLSSVTAMKQNVRSAQEAYGRLFDLPRAPQPPLVRAAELDREIVLDWGSNHPSVQRLEASGIAHSYLFEGYNIYQLPDAKAGVSHGKKIATFDVINGVTTVTRNEFNPVVGQFQPALLQQGTDSGIRRFIRLRKDYLTDGAGLNNGTDYYFAVTAYNHSPFDSEMPSFESSPTIVRVKPGVPFGMLVPSSFGDTLSVSHVSGAGDGRVLPIVINPTDGTGDTYEVRFDTSAGQMRWFIMNVTKNMTLLDNQTNQSGDEDYLIAEGGIMVKVLDDPLQPNSMSDVFRYTIPGTGHNAAAIKASISRTSVFPNPFVLERERGPHSGSVTFTNLPPKTTIRIYNLAGQLVRILRKNNSSQFCEWNLANEQNWQVASGIYLCLIEMPDIGESKILKLAIVQQQLPGQ